MRHGQVKRNRKRGKEGGLVLLMVLLLVIMFTGLGLMAMRHTQGEIRSSGAYMDSLQASALAEGALAMAVTDIKENYSFYKHENPPCGGAYSNYMAQFTDRKSTRLNSSHH
jgi:Tfp pilus assembly protein PilX